MLGLNVEQIQTLFSFHGHDSLHEVPVADVHHHHHHDTSFYSGFLSSDAKLQSGHHHHDTLFDAPKSKESKKDSTESKKVKSQTTETKPDGSVVKKIEVKDSKDAPASGADEEEEENSK